MPKENKKRGRRMEGTKRKHEAEDHDSALAETSKRRKSTDHVETDFAPPENGEDGLEPAYFPVEQKFFGMLDDNEQEYFKHADQMLELNQFDDAEQRQLFLENVWREADGKELKIANSQSCSRLMERLIQLSTPLQLANLFEKFSENFVTLMVHRFASHCCEALFLRSASAVTDELLTKPKKTNTTNGNTPQRSLEDSFIQVLSEIEGSVGFLMTDRFGSHVLRVLLLVLSGEPLDSAANITLLQSKRKEKVTVEGTEKNGSEHVSMPRRVPDSFSPALERLIEQSVAGLDTEKLRALAAHPNGNPALQLLLKIELAHFGKQRAKDERSIIRTLLPDDPITADTNSATFISGLVYEPIGSRLVDTLVECAPAKLFKNLYSTLFKERLPSYARNEIAQFVACRVIERLGKDDLLEAHELIAPQIPSLLERNRTKVVRALIERCTIRDIDTKAIAAQVDATWHGPDGFEVEKLLKIQSAANPQADKVEDGAVSGANASGTAFSAQKLEPTTKAQFNVLAQAMLLVPGPLSSLVLDAMVGLEDSTPLSICKDPIVSRTLQAAIISKTASIITTRKLVQHFYGHIGDMAIDTAASHVVDCIWEGTHGLAFIRERIAEELAENEAHIRESPCGRAVWKNWKMDIYKRRRVEWIRQSKMKASNDGFQSFSELDSMQDGKPKTPLELARARHAKQKAAKQKTGANSKPIGGGRDGRPGSSGGASTVKPAATATT